MTDASQGTSSGLATVPTAPRPVPPQATGVGESAVSTPSHPLTTNQFFDQLARIEDKCSRIEDKYARSESLLSRVEDKVENAANRMNEAARQSDLAALRTEMRGLSERIRRLPATGALVLTAVITAVLTVVLMVAVQRMNLDRLLPQSTAIGTTTQ